MNFLAQIIGCLAVSIWTLSIQNKDRKNILKFQTVANLLYTLEYSLLGAYSAASMNLTSTFRCYIFSKKEKDLNKLTLLFILIMIILGILTYSGLISIIPIIITIFYTISSKFKNANYNRVTVLISAFIWIYYNYKVGAYIGIIGNLLEITSGVIALTRYNVKK